jgi:hypothetical protein
MAGQVKWPKNGWSSKMVKEWLVKYNDQTMVGQVKWSKNCWPKISQAPVLVVVPRAIFDHIYPIFDQ